MKQGMGKTTHMMGTKGDAKAVSLGHVSRMGIHQIHLKPPNGLYTGKVGATAPKCTVTTHHCGSQGKR